jgi:hypothetical protein
MNSFKAVSLDQLDDTAKTGLHIGRQCVEFISNAMVEQFYDLIPPSYIIAFLQYLKDATRGNLKRSMIR